MGFSFALVQNKSQPIMKVLLLVALAIATIMAEPEADAAAHAPDDKVALHPGYATIAANPVVGNPGYPLAKSYVPHYGHYLGKRDAEATADAYGYYGGFYGYPPRYGYGNGYYGYGHRYWG